MFYLVHNGHTQDNYTQPEILREVNKGFDTSIIEPFVQKKPWGNDTTWWFAEKAAVTSGPMLGWNLMPLFGYMTDIQIFGHSLSAQEMWDITSCKSFPKGDIYAWDATDWQPYDKELQKNKTTAVQYRLVDINRNSLCKTSKKFTYFPDKYSFLEGLNLCRRFGGKPLDVSTHAKAKEAVDFTLDIMKNPKHTKLVMYRVFVPYTDEKELNVWRHYETGELPEEPLTWAGAHWGSHLKETPGNKVT